MGYLMVANDIGNSKTKMIIDDELITQPSVVKYILSAPNEVEANVERNVANLLDQLLVHVTSKGIRQNGLYMIGKRANLSGGDQQNMNIRLGNKYKHDIPVLMTLSMLAAYAIQQEFKDTGALPTDLSVTLDMSTAIPASEYKTDRAKYLEDRFLNGKHVVIVHVGEEMITVTLEFERVKVTQEGIPALYALLDSDKGILERYNAQYGKKVTPRYFVDKKIFHTDIGDGTTEYIYTNGMNPVNDACSGERRGVGHATQEAINLLKDETEGFVNYNRQQFMEVYQDTDHRLHQAAAGFMAQARFIQANRIEEDIEDKFMTKAGGNVDVLCVYGGGSIEFDEVLYPSLLDFTESAHCELLWVPAEYAVDMNVRGLNILNKKVFFKKK